MSNWRILHTYDQCLNWNHGIASAFLNCCTIITCTSLAALNLSQRVDQSCKIIINMLPSWCECFAKHGSLSVAIANHHQSIIIDSVKLHFGKGQFCLLPCIMQSEEKGRRKLSRNDTVPDHIQTLYSFTKIKQLFSQKENLYFYILLMSPKSRLNTDLYLDTLTKCRISQDFPRKTLKPSKEISIIFHAS